MRKIAGILGGAAAIVAVTAGAYMPFVIGEARKKHNDRCDYLLILGGDVIGAETPSPQLSERMKAAAKYLNENENVVAIPCGGCFRKNQKKSEAMIIADYLISEGIDKNRIIPEDKSTTTYENFEFAAKIIENHSGKKIAQLSVAFLSSDYHIHRASVIAKQSGFVNCGKVSCPTPGKAAKRFLREYIVAVEVFYKAVKK